MKRRLFLQIAALMQLLGAAAILEWLAFGGIDSPDAKWWLLYAVVLVQGYVLDNHLATDKTTASREDA